MVLDRVVSAPRQHLRHLCPLAPVGRVSQEQDPLLVQHPLHLQDARVQVVVPPLPALLPQPPLHELGNEGPPLRTILLDKLADQVILFLRPRLFPEKFGPVVVGLGC